MGMGTAFLTRRAMCLSLGLAATYALATAVEFYPPDEDLLIGEAMFAGPMLMAGFLTVLTRRVEAHRVLAGFQVAYVVVTLAILYSTFTGEQDAQYQLKLLFIPLFGYPSLLCAGLIAFCLR